ncbi:unnamed protein product [Brassica napus]|uniref:(rape) hypothetical protein n=1 Tax=Brassica napus TaxID=3708 RepID=A0A816IW03_BRANA|nr:unnamed protein product [Brassica napus]
MANSKVFLSDLISGRCSSTVEVRLLRLRELMSVDMLLRDSKHLDSAS